jgi:hypothetical protein
MTGAAPRSRGAFRTFRTFRTFRIRLRSLRIHASSGETSPKRTENHGRDGGPPPPSHLSSSHFANASGRS